MNEYELREKFEAWADGYGLDNARFAEPDNGPSTRYTGQYQNAEMQFAWEAVAHCCQHDGHAELEATIADLRERHDAFVRAVREITDGTVRGKYGPVDGLNQLLALCDAEISKENSNG